MILITGATGNIGAEMVSLLIARGERVRLLVRDARKVAHLGDGVEVVTGDLLEPSTLPAAFVGVERAFVMIGTIVDIPTAAAPIFAAAKAAGVGQVVFLSSGTIQMRPQTTVGRWHAAGEDALKATDLPWTMLRPGNFASNSLRWVGSIRAQGSVFLPHDSQRSSVIDPRDIAAVAVAALNPAGSPISASSRPRPRTRTPPRPCERSALQSSALGRPRRPRHRARLAARAPSR